MSGTWIYYCPCGGGASTTNGERYECQRCGAGWAPDYSDHEWPRYWESDGADAAAHRPGAARRAPTSEPPF